MDECQASYGYERDDGLFICLSVYSASFCSLMLKGKRLFLEKTPPAMSRSPHSRMARWPNTSGELEKYIGTESVPTMRQEKELLFVVCTAGAFIGCLDKVKSE